MIARIVSAQTVPDGFDNLIRFTEERSPEFRAQPGFKGFYLLTDRDTGNLMTISLWDTWEDMRAVEAAAAQVNKDAAQSVDAKSAPPATYKVEIALLA